MANADSTGTLKRADHTPTAPLPALAVEALAPADRLAADFARWASRPHRVADSIEGYQLLRVLRILARPAYGLTALVDEAARLDRLVKQGDAEGWNARRRAATEAERAADAAYTVILRDVDTLFAELTGLDADSVEGLDVELPLVQLAAESRKLDLIEAAR